MGDPDRTTVHGGARPRLIGGLVMLAVPVVAWAAALIHARWPSDAVALEFLGSTAVLWVVTLAFGVGALPLLVPQRVPPADYRENRWYAGIGLCLSLLQLAILPTPTVNRRTLAETFDRERAVVLYDPGTRYACLRVWHGIGVMARVVGDIGAPGPFTGAYFRDRDTVVLSPGSAGGRWVPLDPRTGRPREHTGPCVRRSR